MRRAVLARLSLLLVFLSATTLLSFGQGMKPTPQQIDRGEDEQDNPAARLKWFMEGRLTPDGKLPAAWINRALEQKFELRSLREQQMRRMLQSLPPGGQLSGITVGNGFTVWTPLGPAPIEPDPAEGVNWNQISGRVSAIAVDPSDATGNTVYIGGATGGVWKSTNAAASDPTTVVWTPVIDQQKTLAVGSIAVSPDGSTVLVGTGEAKNAIDSYYGQGILRSTDRGATWTLITGDGTHTFLGVGIAKIAFNTTNPNVVVAAATSTGLGNAEGAFTSGVSWSGLWRSGDGGATWTAITSGVTDGTTATSVGAAHSVVYNAAAGKFLAQYRFHGIYQSTDGLTWTRLTTQPDNTTLSAINCPAVTNTLTCPVYRAEMAVRAGKNETYVWYVDSNGTLAADNHGVWLSTDGGGTWSSLDKTGIDTCLAGEQGCSVAQGWFYNMTIAAAPNPGNSALTDVYVGAVNLFKCTVDPSSAASRCQSTNAEPNKFMNITHVYGSSTGCVGFGTFAKIHPDQHAIAPSGIASLIYFGNDGGVYRTKNSAALSTAVCGSQPAGGMPFDSLNANVGALTQFIWATPHPTDPTGFIAGAQDNASTMTSSSIAGTLTSSNGKSFFPFAGGDGGYNAIRTDLGGTVLYSSFTQAQIVSCNTGFACNTPDNLVVQNSDLVATGTTSSDSSAFYTPWVLDRYDPSKLVLGTCRVWRGNANPGATATYNGVILSQKLANSSGALNCTSGDPDVSAIAVGGPKSTTAGIAKVNYAAVFGVVGGVLQSSMWMTAAADASTLPGTWTDVTPSALNPNRFKISSVTIDQAGDPSGMTVYATIQGFGGAHVIKSVNGGTSWTNITGNLPDAPANTLAIDPDDHTVIYAGTDTGVYVTTNGGVTWTEVGPTLPGTVSASGYLPNVPVTHLAFSTAGGLKQLMAATYGRGIWLADLTTTNAPQVSFDKPSLDFSSVAVNSVSSAQTLTLTNSGNSSLQITSISIGGTNFESFSQTNNCPATLPSAGSCTISVTAIPTATGPRNATVAVSDNAAGSPQSVPLTVTGVTPTIAFAPTTIAFGKQALLTASSATPVTFTNNTVNPVTISSIGITGTGAASFSSTNTCPASPATLAAGASCTANVTFTPQSRGALSAFLSVVDNAAGSPRAVPVTGTGAISLAALSGTTLNFPVQRVGTSALQNVTLTANGEFDSHITAITTTAPFAVVSNTCGPLPKTISIGSSCVFQVSFTPTVTGPAPATNLTITDDNNNIPGSTQILALSGSGGIGTATITGGPLSFSGTPLNTGSSTKALTITNNGTVATTIAAIVIGGTNNADFTQANTCQSALSPGGSCTVTVTFKPTATGSRSATLSVTHDGTASPSTTTMSGTGEDFAQSTGTTTATVTAGGSATFTMTETPAAGTFVNPITFSCTGLDSTMGCTFNPAQVTPGSAAATTTVTITTRKAGSAAPSLKGVASSKSAMGLLAFLLALPGMAVFFPTVSSQKLTWKKKLSAVLFLVIALAMTVAMSGCSSGGGTPGTSLGSHSIGVVATSGSLSHTTTVALTVQ